MPIDHTHDPAKRSWVSSANDGQNDFPIQNLPLGVFSAASGRPRCGVAIGDFILDLQLCAAAGAISDGATMAAVADTNLDNLLALGGEKLTRLRHEIFALLDTDHAEAQPQLLHEMADCVMHLPTSVRSFSDFFAGVHHAVRCAEIMGNAANPLPANYHHLPIGYNGRASTVRISGEEVKRPLGLRQKLGDAAPDFGPSQWLDFELELGCILGRGNAIGLPVRIADAPQHIAGLCLLNDWSARDLQLLEMVPLGPLNSKSVSTTISPWVITLDALAPFRGAPMARFADAPPLAAYLDDENDRASGGFTFELYAAISTPQMREAGLPPARIVHSNARHLYWSFSQIIAHQSINGCALVTGDVIGSGTVSGPDQASYASLFELTAAGHKPIPLPNGETRAFLEDGDEISLSARCKREGFAPIGFGSCSGRIAPAPSFP